jgi:cell cycle checkpoint protein
MDSRDKKLSTFHALGKILYAKRVDHIPQGRLNHEKDYHDYSWNVDKRPPLQFDAETVLEESDIGIHGALNFVQFHSPDFFSEISDISQAFSNFSDAAYLLDSPYEVSASLSNDIHIIRYNDLQYSTFFGSMIHS